MATAIGRQSEAPSGHAVAADLIAVLVAVTGDEPRVTVQDGSALPSGPFAHDGRSLQSGLRTWVEQQTGHPLGALEANEHVVDVDPVIAARARRAVARMLAVRT